MKKKLTAKVQQLNPNLPQYNGSFSRCVVIEPETKEVLLRKGSVYAIFEIQSDASFDTELITKVTNDVIHNSYYQSENISPIQSMEKTILEARDKIIQLSSDVLRQDQQAIKFNVVASVLWGNVLYTVQHGDMSGFIVEEGVIKPITMVSEGNFSAASQVVNNDDVIIFCTKSFERELPPEKLLSSSVSDQSLKPNQACLLMKLIVDTSLTEDETIDFGLEKAISKAKSKAASEKGLDVFRSIFSGFKKATGKVVGSRLPKIRLPQIRGRASSIVPSTIKFSPKPWMAIPFVLVILVMIIIPLIRSKKAPAQKVTENTQESTASVTTGTSEQAQQLTAEEIKAIDTAYKVTRLNPEVFYDVKISDAQAEPSDIAVFIDKIVAADKTTGKIFISDIKTPKFTAQANTYPGIRSIVNADGKLNFLDNSGFKIYNLVSLGVSEEQAITADIAFPYSGYVYAVSQDIIKKYKDAETTPVTWGQKEDFRNAKSIAIAFNIFLINSKNELVSYSAGNKTDFKVTGLENGFSDAIKVVADVDLKNMYVADKGNKSVVVLDNKGNLIRQFKADKDETWNDIRSISVSPDEKTLFVLSGSKVFTVNLSN